MRDEIIYSNIQSKPICWCCSSDGSYISDAPACDACCYEDPDGGSPISFIDSCAKLGGTTTTAVDFPC
jgi:hypothetical protein